MKKIILTIVIVLFNFLTSNAQIFSDTIRSSNGTILIHQNNDGIEKLFVRRKLSFYDDVKKQGMYIETSFRKKNGVWVYWMLEGKFLTKECSGNVKMNLIFDDGSTLNLTYYSDNCDYIMNYYISSEIKNKLNNSIKSIRIETMKESFILDVKEESDKKYFINTFAALEEFNKK